MLRSPCARWHFEPQPTSFSHNGYNDGKFHFSGKHKSAQRIIFHTLKKKKPLVILFNVLTWPAGFIYICQPAQITKAISIAVLCWAFTGKNNNGANSSTDLLLALLGQEPSGKGPIVQPDLLPTEHISGFIAQHDTPISEERVQAEIFIKDIWRRVCLPQFFRRMEINPDMSGQ